MRRKILLFILLITFTLSFINCSYYGFSFESKEAIKARLEEAIWEYKHENYEEAYDILKVLRKQDPTSSMIAYYLGVTCKKMQNYAEAATNLEAACTLKPRIKNALIELIDLLYKKGDLKGALKWIDLAQRENIEPAQVYFLKGLVLLKQGEDIDGAQNSLKQAKNLEPSMEQTIDYYMGLSYVRSEKLDEAKKIFEEVAKDHTGSSMGTFANQYIDLINAKEKTERPFRGDVGVALQYDDNVLLEPGDVGTAVAIGNKGDWRQVYTFNSEYNFKPMDMFGTRLGYSLYVAKQFDLGFYDMVDHNFSAQPSVYLDNVAVTFPVCYKWTSVNDKAYLSTVNVGNVNNIKLPGNQIAQTSFMWRKKEYLWSAFSPEENRDANEWIGHLGWFHFFAKNQAFAHMKYQINYDSTRGSNWEHVGNRLLFSSTVPLIEDKLKLGANAEYAYLQFLNTNTYYDRKRRDNVLTLSGVLTFQIFENAEIVLNYIHVNNGSNLGIYSYRRNIYSVGVRYVF